MDNPPRYSPHHPWYYRENPPPPVESIEPFDTGRDIPRSRDAREAELRKAEQELARDTERYLDLAENGEAALSGFDRISDGLHVALSLKHNHIAANKARVAALRKAPEPEQPSLF